MGRKARLKKLRRSWAGEEAPSQKTGTAPSVSIDRKRGDSLFFPTLKKIILAIITATLLAVGINLRIVNLHNVAARSPDERVYSSHARTIAEQGMGSIKSLAQAYNKDANLWLYPPPIRVGYLWLLSNLMKITGDTSDNIGSYISFTSSILSLVLLIVIGLKFFNPWITLYALLFTAASPVDLAIARRTWQDSMLACLGLALIYLCCQIRRNSKNIVWYALFFLVGIYCVTFKETGPVIYGLSAAWLLWIVFIEERSILKGAILGAVSFICLIVGVAIVSQAVGGFSVLKEALRHEVEVMPTNDYIVQYQSGPWTRFLGGIWIISPLSSILFIIGIIGAFSPNRPFQKTACLDNKTSRNAIFGMLFIIAAFTIITITPKYLQNFRFLSVLFIPFYLISGVGLWYILTFARTLLKGFGYYAACVIIAIALLGAATNDYKNFRKIFIRTGILDVSIRMIQEYSRL